MSHRNIANRDLARHANKPLQTVEWRQDYSHRLGQSQLHHRRLLPHGGLNRHAQCRQCTGRCRPIQSIAGHLAESLLHGLAPKVPSVEFARLRHCSKTLYAPENLGF